MGSPAHEAESPQDGNGEQKPAKDAEPGAKKPGSKAQGRKRTKTGCLTCRRRRIKCGEERPTCQNCHKSKRQCEGYNQRVVFKDPLNAYRGPPLSATNQVSFSEPISNIRQGGDLSQQLSTANPLPIAPKPGPLGLSTVAPDSASEGSIPSATTPGTERRVYSFSTAPEYPTPSNSVAPKPHNLDINYDTIDRSHIPEPRGTRPLPQSTTHYDFDALHIKQETRDQLPIITARPSPLDWPAGPTSASLSSSQELFYDSNSRFPATASFFQSYPTTSTWQQPTAIPSTAGPSFCEVEYDSKAHRTPAELFRGAPEHSKEQHDDYLQSEWDSHRPAYMPQPVLWRTEIGPSLMGQQYLVEDDEDDPYDVSDEEMEENEYEDMAWQGQLQDSHLRNNDLGIAVALQARQETYDIRLRTITSFIDRPNMLATYTPSPQSSPLNDSMTARLFCHFIHVTGPTMSMFERHPANPSLIFQGQPVSMSQQHIWTYTFPTLALQSQGLLHAMLALASLHIAKLQNGPITASLKHYAIGLRRVAKSLSSPSRRGQPATLAACMLLAFYECWSADHQKWSNHLLGAKQLVREIDYSGMTKQIKSLKAQHRQKERETIYQAEQQGSRGYYEDRTRFQATIEDVDENIVGMLMGQKLRYDQYGRIMDDAAPDRGSGRIFTQRELEVYETQRDLFWWYCKQDVYQSILGGGRLLSVLLDHFFWTFADSPVAWNMTCGVTALQGRHWGG
ncbi:putative transcriptional regulatory [Hyphodiscus hymeniophilus]|uniref:Transcriptional regulatory n=1 Tax=Hyphodiscus hymeniophilus TaxID=353542 RepID=A0A9P6VK72_9HELO|nr:putative transcriptional regulatory [Hyphodiscus hymeniophilus]